MNLPKDPPRIGILYPHHSAEDDYPRLAELMERPAEVHIAHTEGPDVHQIESSLVTGSDEMLATGAEELKAHNVEVCMWACTSGSFAFGVAGARRQADKIGELLGVPTSSTSLAFLSAVHALGLKRVAIAATYPEELSGAFRAFLEEEAVEVHYHGLSGDLVGAKLGK